MKLVENWRDAWSWYSEWAFAGITTVAGITVYLTPEMLAAPILFLPDWTWAKAAAAVVAFLAVSGGIARLIPQPPKEPAVDVEVP
jgi:hypothetical protein